MSANVGTPISSSGKGMHKAGWHADRLDAPGKFLLSAPEHDIPRRARAYLLTDQIVQDTAVRHAERRPALDPASLSALHDAPSLTQTAVSAYAETAKHARKDAHQRADEALWDVLTAAPDEGATLSDLITATGMSRPTVYRRLGQLEADGRIRQVSRGRWRAHHGDSA